MDIAQRHSLMVVEDACQAVGVDYKGRKCGSFGEVGVYSFNHYKNMTIGEGGAVVTNDPALFSRLMNFHDLGIWAREGYEAGNNPAFLASHSRVTEVQGAMLDVQLSRTLAQYRAHQAQPQSHRAGFAGRRRHPNFAAQRSGKLSDDDGQF